VAVCLQMVVRWPGQMLCRRDSVVWWMLCHLWLLRVWRMLCRYSSTLADALLPLSCYSVDASPPSCASCLLSLGIFDDSILCRSYSSGGLCLGGLFGVSSPSVLLLLSACCASGYGCFVCSSIRFLQCFFIFSHLCSCVGLFGRNKFVSITAFFLMKNVLRHSREKKILFRER